MLSPGQWHKLVPKDAAENLRWRLAILKAAEKDPRIQKGLMSICKQDILFWVNLFGIQINPKMRVKGPFISWPYQDVAFVGGETEIGGEKRFQHGILACVEDMEDVRWPKSREGGASYVVLFAMVWLCLFHDNIIAGAISRDEDSVDKLGDPSSLFEKIRIILQYLPDWMKGVTNPKKANIIFDNGNIITGEANVGSSGVGSRFTVMLVDEFGQFDKHGEDIYNFTSDTCDCRVFVYTHKDTSGMAYTLAYDTKFSKMREIMTHWSQHPEKNKGLYRDYDDGDGVEILDKGFDFSALLDFDFVRDGKPTGGPCPGIRSPWYDKQCLRRTERDITMNLDIDPRGSPDRFFDAYRIGVLKSECVPPLWVGNIIHKEGRCIRLERDAGGLLKLWVNPKAYDDSAPQMPLMRACAAVDVAAGTGQSPSVLSIGNADTGEKIAEYANATIFQHDFASLCVAFLRLIQDKDGMHPMFAWENQGSAVLARCVIRQYRYFPVYKRESKVGHRYVPKNTDVYGWVPNPKSILTLMEEYKAGLYDKQIINYSEAGLDECLNFVYHKDSVEYRARGKKMMDASGAGVHHGDIVRADALMYMMMREAGLSQSAVQEASSSEWDIRTSGGRERLAEMEWAKEESEVWV
jgi:hypothetical protein